MHPRRSWIALGLVAALTAQSAVIYKWTDANGVVHYSDQPMPGAETIVTTGKSLNSYSAAPASNAGGTPPPRAGTPGQPAAASLTITSPQPEQSFFDDDPITVSLSQPTLGPGQSVTWHLNGRQLTDQSTAQFVLPNPGRGAFSIAATISNQSTGETQTTPSVTFYVKEPSALSPQHRRP
jgi:hypothetical protein